MMVIQFYFQTLDYETLIFYQESFIDFLCKYWIFNLHEVIVTKIFIIIFQPK